MVARQAHNLEVAAFESCPRYFFTFKYEVIMNKEKMTKIRAAAKALQDEIESATVKELGEYSCYLTRVASNMEDLGAELDKELAPKGRKKTK